MASISQLALEEKLRTQINWSVNQSLTQLIWCPENWSFHFGTWYYLFYQKYSLSEPARCWRCHKVVWV